MINASAIGTNSTEMAVLRPRLRFLALMASTSASVSARMRCLGGCSSLNESRAPGDSGIGLGLRLARDEDEDGVDGWRET